MPLFYFAWDSYQLDFRAFYVAAQSSAHHLDPYVDNRGNGEQFTDPMVQSAASRWIYPPPALFAVTPFARLSYTSARALFTLASMLSLTAVLVYLSGQFLVADPWIMLACMSLPVIACLERGQIDIMILLLLVIAFSSGKRFWGGIPLGIAIAIKIFPVAVLLWLLLQRRFSQALTTIVCVSILVLLGAWQYGASSYSHFIYNLTSSDPNQQIRPAIDLVGRIGALDVNGHLLALSHSLVGSYNNPLVLLGSSGIAIGILLVFAAAILMRRRLVSEDVGFFTMVLLSQLVNTRLWSMGVVMYLPICLLMIARLHSRRFAFALMIPLFLPSQVRIHGISPRFVIAIALIAYFIFSEVSRKNIRQIDSPEEPPQPGLATSAMHFDAPAYRPAAKSEIVSVDAI